MGHNETIFWKIRSRFLRIWHPELQGGPGRMIKCFLTPKYYQQQIFWILNCWDSSASVTKWSNDIELRAAFNSHHQFGWLLANLNIQWKPCHYPFCLFYSNFLEIIFCQQLEYVSPGAVFALIKDLAEFKLTLDLYDYYSSVLASLREWSSIWWPWD